MTWLKRILTVIVVLAALFVLVGMLLSETFEYEASILVDASPDAIHPYLDNLEEWPKWMPFYEDPDLELIPGDAMRGVEANQTWKDASGTGSVLMTASDAATGVIYDITFIDGKVAGKAEISFADASDENERPASEWTTTKVVWTMDGTYGDLMTRWFGALMGGKTSGMLETGLGNLKTLVETPLEDSAEE